MSLLALICISIMIGYACGWAACASRYRQRAEIDKTLRDHKEFMRNFEERYPEYRGTQWGKP